MNNKERIEKLKNSKYQEIFGVTKETFEKMLNCIEKAYEQLHLQGGRPPKLSVLDKLVITLSYYREYRTMEHIEFDYDVSKSTVCESILWVEKVLISCPDFHLPNRAKLLKEADENEILMVDARECEIERPKKKQKDYYSGKKRHTLKF